MLPCRILAFDDNRIFTQVQCYAIECVLICLCSRFIDRARLALNSNASVVFARLILKLKLKSLRQNAVSFLKKVGPEAQLGVVYMNLSKQIQFNPLWSQQKRNEFDPD